jgi:hypothetical protein
MQPSVGKEGLMKTLTEKDLARLARVVFQNTGLKEKEPELKFETLPEGVRKLYRAGAAGIAQELGFGVPDGKRESHEAPVPRRLDDLEIERLAKASWSRFGEKELEPPPAGSRWVWAATGRPVHPEELVSDWTNCKTKNIYRRIAAAVAVELGFTVAKPHE